MMSQDMDYNFGNLDNVMLFDESNYLLCEQCGKTFSSTGNLNQHLKTHAELKDYICGICSKRFCRNSDLNRHKISHTRDKILHKCDICHNEFLRKSELLKHVRLQHVESRGIKRKLSLSEEPNKRSREDFSVRKSKSALDVFYTTNMYPSEETSHDINIFFNDVQPKLIEEILNKLTEQKSLKWETILHVKLIRTSSEGDEETIPAYFHSRFRTEFTEDTLSSHVDEAFIKMNSLFEEFIQRGSGWTLDKIEKLELRCARNNPLAASSYLPLPTELEKKKAVLNIKNMDQKCFLWCILAHKLNLDYSKQPNRVSHYIPFENEILMGNVTYPVPVCKIPIVERLNDLRINVFGYEDDEICPLYISSMTHEDCINLLLISNETQQHYCLIRNMSRLLGDRTKHHGKRFYCFRCLHRFSEERLLKEHSLLCNQHEVQKIKMPTEEDCILTFTNRHYQHDVPYVIYADFESLVVPLNTSNLDNTSSYTVKTHIHEPCGYAFIIIGPAGEAIKPIQCYRGSNTVQHFLESIIKEKEELADKLCMIKPLVMSVEEEEAFLSATNCFLCDKPLGNDRVRDHDHINGKYRGALHNACNLKYRMSKTIPVIFHNLKQYDGHLIMQQLGKIHDHRFDVIATNMEKYISFSISNKNEKTNISLRFIDSFQFLPTSLQNLVENLEKDQFSLLQAHFPSNTDLLLRKGIYPYEYMDSHQKFEDKQLPPKSAFHSELTGEDITDADYHHAENIWSAFQITDMGAYHDLYVQTDVLQLADVFQNFRLLCSQFYNLDCMHMLTAPGLAWQSCLKMCNTPLELLTDPDMHLLIEQGIRGGISVITKRSSEANNKYLDNYNPDEASKYIMYLDCNNLYGWAMSQSLPYGKFEWMSTDQISAQWILSLSVDGPEGYFFEVDLEYPNHLHEFHNEYPLAAEKMDLFYEDFISIF